MAYKRRRVTVQEPMALVQNYTFLDNETSMVVDMLEQQEIQRQEQQQKQQQQQQRQRNNNSMDVHFRYYLTSRREVLHYNDLKHQVTASGKKCLVQSCVILHDGIPNWNFGILFDTSHAADRKKSIRVQEVAGRNVDRWGIAVIPTQIKAVVSNVGKHGITSVVLKPDKIYDDFMTSIVKNLRQILLFNYPNLANVVINQNVTTEKVMYLLGVPREQVRSGDTLNGFGLLKLFETNISNNVATIFLKLNQLTVLRVEKQDGLNVGRQADVDFDFRYGDEGKEQCRNEIVIALGDPTAVTCDSLATEMLSTIHTCTGFDGETCSTDTATNDLDRLSAYVRSLNVNNVMEEWLAYIKKFTDCTLSNTQQLTSKINMKRSQCEIANSQYDAALNAIADQCLSDNNASASSGQVSCSSLFSFQ